MKLERLGWRLDADYAFDNDFRVIQLTPGGSAASVQNHETREELS